MIRLAIRYEMRAPEIGSPAAALYRAAIEQVEWADRLGFDSVYLAEHHGAQDGYLPAPLVLASALASRTSRIEIHLQALLVTLHDAVHLAEDLTILDLISGGGRIAITAGMGYRPHEFDMFGVDRATRAKRYEETVEALRAAFAGEPISYRGLTLDLQPKPLPPGPRIYIGGSAEPSARRAARMGLPYWPATRSLYDVYVAECKRLGRPEPEPLVVHGPRFLHISDDPERDWPLVAPHVQYTTNAYVEWSKERPTGGTEWTTAQSVDDLKASGLFHVVTPDECVALAEGYGELRLHPLMGGLDPDLAWQSLELFEHSVLPALERKGLRALRTRAVVGDA